MFRPDSPAKWKEIGAVEVVIPASFEAQFPFVD
jgi:hypothetical protein